MSAAFDPYHEWLSIPPSEQPPHHYRLLGVELFESNPSVIDNAADRQVKHLRDCQTGKHGDASQRLLSEVAAARVCLLDPEKKAAYDAQLQAKIAAKKKERAKQERPLAVATPLPEQPQAAPAPEKPAVAAPAIATAGRRRGKKSLAPLLIAGGGLLLLVIVAAGAAVVFWPQPNAGSNNVAAVIDPSQPETTPPNNSTDPTPKPPEVIAPPPPPLVTRPKEPPPPDENVEPPDGATPATQIDEPDPPANDPKVEAPPPEAAPQEKLPVPAKEIRDQKREQIAAIFPIDAAHTFEEKGELAANLIRTARDTKSDPPAQFALLNLARDQAAEAGQIKLAFEAIELLNEVFEFPADNVRVASLDAAAKAAIPPAAKRDIVTLGMGMIDGFIAADEFAKADALSERMITIARPLRDAELIKSLADQRRTADALAADYRQAKAAFETLKTTPDDPAANLAAGRYLTFVKQDWDAGLPHLAKGSDELLAAAAKLELASPASAAEQEKLADAWWAAGEAQKDTASKDLCRALASNWYRKVVSELSGLAKAKVEKRISEAPAWTDPRQSTPSVPAAREPVEGLVAHWKFDEGQGAVAGDSVGGHQGKIKGATWTEGIHGGALRFNGTSNYVIVEGQPRLETHRGISLSAWVRPREMPTGNGLALIVQHVTDDVWRTVVLSCLKGSGEYYGGITISSKKSTVNASIPEEDVNQWAHLCLTHDGSQVRFCDSPPLSDTGGHKSYAATAGACSAS